MIFNLIVICSGYCEHCSDVFDSDLPVRVEGLGDRLFEATSWELIERFAPDVSKLASLRTLIMAEGHDSPVVVGRISSLELGREITRPRSGLTYREIVSFEFEKVVGGLKVGEILESKWLKGLELVFYLHRCHWSVREGNLEQAVFETVGRVCEKRLEASNPRPKIFTVQEWPMPVREQIAVMMPFKEEFNPIYDAIKSACSSQSMKAIRVDELRRPTAIIDDIHEIIIQSRLVICDFTEKNPNVAYEAGIAHTRNKSVIALTQNLDDIGFDLKHRRTILYSPDHQGLKTLKHELSLTIKETLLRESQDSAGGN